MSYIHIQNGFTELFGVVFRYFFLYKRCLHLPNLEDLAELYSSLIPAITLTVSSPSSNIPEHVFICLQLEYL